MSLAPIPPLVICLFVLERDQILTLFQLDSIVICAIYYVAWMYILPRLRHYQVRQEIVSVGGSAASHKLVKVPAEQLAIWDSTHDASGRLVIDHNEKEEGMSHFKE